MFKFANTPWADHEFNGFAPGHAGNDEVWKEPARWDAQARAQGVRRRVYCSGDPFSADFSLGACSDLLSLIEATPNLDWVIFTSAPAQLEDALELVVRTLLNAAKGSWNSSHWPNLWMGVVVHSQKLADELVPQLLDAPISRRVVLLYGPEEAINLPGMVFYGTERTGGVVPLRHKGYSQVDWVILAGEEGENSRPMHPDWVRSVQEQCEFAEVPFYFSGWGDWVPRGPQSLGYPVIDDVPRVRITDLGQNDQDLGSEGDEPVWMQRAGPERSGRQLDGHEWGQVPIPE